MGLVCPYHLKHGLLTVCAIDNRDDNPSSTRTLSMELELACLNFLRS